MGFRFTHFKVLTQRLMAVMLAYTIIRLLFFSVHRASFSGSFEEIVIAFLHGLRFDLSAVLYLNLLYILLFLSTSFMRPTRLFSGFMEILFYVVNFAGFLFNIIDIEYFKFQKMRSTLDLFNGENDLTTMLPAYLRDYWWMVIMSIALVFMLRLVYRNTEHSLKYDAGAKGFFKGVSTLLFLGLVVLGARGGLQVKPIRVLSASYYGNAQNSALVLNTPFVMMQSYGQKQLEEKAYLKDDELAQVFNIDRKYRGSFLFEKKNVIIIILESFSNEYIGTFNAKNANCSPFLDSLMGEGMLFTNAYANGKKSNEAMPSVIASIPSLMSESFTNSFYQRNNINTLPKLLKEEGYYSCFYHGGLNGSMSFDIFAKNAGYDSYVGMNEYPNLNDYDGNWGIYDMPFMQFFAESLGSAPKPFFATLFTLSSHPPYQIPAQFENSWPEIEDSKLRAFRYTDEALRAFFKYAQRKNWYTNTLFVILPDHTPDTKNPRYDTRVSFYQIPILFFDPSANLQKRNNNLMQQVDIMPSILDYLHYNKSYKSFGNSCWNWLEGSNPKTVNSRDGMFQCIDSAYVLQYAEDKPIALYNYKSDPYLRADLLEIELEKRKELQNYLEAYIQTYNYTLIHNTYQ